jgi:hypothetical protein
MRRLAVTAVLALATTASAGIAAAANKGACDRACLDKMVDTYLAAVVAHDTTKAPLAKDVKFVENVERITPGEGLWKTASAVPTTFKIYVPDPVAGQVGFLGMMEENGKPIELGLRLKVRNGKITEAEHLVARELRETSMKNLQTPRPAFLATVPPAERMPRDQMLRIAATYYDALVNGDGKAAPFADDCVRRENGMQTTGNPPPEKPGRGTMGAMGCGAQLDTKTMSYIKRIEPRRVEIADPETGLVFGLSQFRHPMEEKFVKIVGVPGVEKVDLPFDPFDLPAAHIYKVAGGKIHEIEAMGFRAPYNSKTGWE